jgi:predicted lipoprotein with Yx(FWY)xxD motif
MAAFVIGETLMRSSRLALAALLPSAMRFPSAARSAALCLAAALGLAVAACGTTSPVAGAAYGATAAATPKPSASASGTASGAPVIPAKAVLTVRKTKIGYVLATASGHTIYWFSKDVKGSGTSACTGSCLAAWPAVTGAPVAASGVRLAGKLGTITRSGGVVQVTYNGYPLYTYAADMTPGQALGNDASGVWHVITGTVLSPSPASAAAASARDMSA